MAPKSTPASRRKKELVANRERTACLRAQKAELCAAAGITSSRCYDLSFEVLKSMGVILRVDDEEKEEESIQSPLSYEERVALKRAENAAALEALGVLDAVMAIRELRGGGPPEHACCSEGSMTCSSAKLVPTRLVPVVSSDEVFSADPELITEKEVLSDAAIGVGLRFGVLGTYVKRGHKPATAWFYGCAIAAPFVESLSSRSLTVAFDVMYNEDTGEWSEWVSTERLALKHKHGPHWYLAREQWPNGSHHTWRGEPLPFGFPCPGGCGARLIGAGELTSCKQCGSFERNGRVVWRPVDGLNPVRVTRSTHDTHGQSSMQLLDDMLQHEEDEKRSLQWEHFRKQLRLAKQLGSKPPKPPKDLLADDAPELVESDDENDVTYCVGGAGKSDGSSSDDDDDDELVASGTASKAMRTATRKFVAAEAKVAQAVCNVKDDSASGFAYDQEEVVRTMYRAAGSLAPSAVNGVFSSSWPEWQAVVWTFASDRTCELYVSLSTLRNSLMDDAPGEDTLDAVLQWWHTEVEAQRQTPEAQHPLPHTYSIHHHVARLSSVCKLERLFEKAAEHWPELVELGWALDEQRLQQTLRRGTQVF